MNIEYFDYYPVSSYTVISASDDTRGRLQAIREIGRNVQDEHRPAVDAVEGEIEDSVANAPTDVLRQVSDVERNAEYAAGCLEYFGLAIDEFDYTGQGPRSVSGLNQAYREALYDSFYVNRDDYVDGPDDEAGQQEYLDAYQGAQARIIHDLEAEYGRSEERLDGKAEEAARLLREGATDGNVKTLWGAGALPFYAPLAFVDVDLTNLATTDRVVEQMQTFFENHPELRNDPYLGVLRSMVIGPMPSQDQIDDSLDELRDAGLLEGEPDSYYLEWLTWTLRRGVDPWEIVERAEQEDVSMERFDPLRELERIEDQDGRGFYLLTDDEGAKDIARLTELLHGGTPSITDHRRSNNEWTYDGFLMSDSDVEFVLDRGGAIVATPEGTLMAASGPDVAGLPNDADLLSFSGGTTWMEMFVLNGSNDDPEQRLRDEIGDDGLAQLLLHERLHSEQWSDEGYWQFVGKYLAEQATGGVLNGANNDFERDAVLPWGGY
jgi:hypothetical protein